jgi:hypothetical protein
VALRIVRSPIRSRAKALLQLFRTSVSFYATTFPDSGFLSTSYPQNSLDHLIEPRRLLVVRAHSLNLSSQKSTFSKRIDVTHRSSQKLALATIFQPTTIFPVQCVPAIMLPHRIFRARNIPKAQILAGGLERQAGRAIAWVDPKLTNTTLVEQKNTTNICPSERSERARASVASRVGSRCAAPGFFSSDRETQVPK